MIKPKCNFSYQGKDFLLYKFAVNDQPVGRINGSTSGTNDQRKKLLDNSEDREGFGGGGGGSGDDNGDSGDSGDGDPRPKKAPKNRQRRQASLGYEPGYEENLDVSGGGGGGHLPEPGAIEVLVVGAPAPLWIPTNAKQAPLVATKVPGGFAENREREYVCRHYFARHQAMLSGMYLAGGGRGKCIINLGDRVHSERKSFELLTNPEAVPLRWVGGYRYGDAPKNAFLGGYNKGTLGYIARVDEGGSRQVGRTALNKEAVLFVYKGKAKFRRSGYQVLVFDEDAGGGGGGGGRGGGGGGGGGGDDDGGGGGGDRGGDEEGRGGRGGRGGKGGRGGRGGKGGKGGGGGGKGGKGGRGGRGHGRKGDNIESDGDKIPDDYAELLELNDNRKSEPTYRHFDDDAYPTLLKKSPVVADSAAAAADGADGVTADPASSDPAAEDSTDPSSSSSSSSAESGAAASQPFFEKPKNGLKKLIDFIEGKGKGKGSSGESSTGPSAPPKKVNLMSSKSGGEKKVQEEEEPQVKDPEEQEEQEPEEQQEEGQDPEEPPATEHYLF